MLGVSRSLPKFDLQLRHLTHVVLSRYRVLIFPGFGAFGLMMVSLVTHLLRICVELKTGRFRVVASPATELEVLVDQFMGEK